jgi:hypothetical protein
LNGAKGRLAAHAIWALTLEEEMISTVTLFTPPAGPRLFEGFGPPLVLRTPLRRRLEPRSLLSAIGSDPNLMIPFKQNLKIKWKLYQRPGGKKQDGPKRQ